MYSGDGIRREKSRVRDVMKLEFGVCNLVMPKPCGLWCPSAIVRFAQGDGTVFRLRMGGSICSRDDRLDTRENWVQRARKRGDRGVVGVVVVERSFKHPVARSGSLATGPSSETPKRIQYSCGRGSRSWG